MIAFAHAAAADHGSWGGDGRLDPSHAFLARLAAVSEATVRRPLDRLCALELLTWQRRLVRTRWRAEQTSNACVLTPTSACDVQIEAATRASG